MNPKKILGCIVLMGCAPYALAMQPMDDNSLAATTGQNGITLGITVPKVEFNQLSLIDQNGIATPVPAGAGNTRNYNQKASFVVSRAGSPVRLDFVGNSSNGTLNAVIDAAAVNNNAFANLAVSFAQQIKGLKISPFSIYLAGGQSTSGLNNPQSIFNNGTLKSDVRELIRLGSDIDINFAENNSPRMNIQLGNAPQGHMVQFSGAIQSVCANGCPITLVSDNTGASANFSLNATNAAGFSLNSFYAGVESDGVVLGNRGQSSKVNVGLGNVSMGTLGQSQGDVFNGTRNGSMGNVGAVGASVTDLKIKISGM